MIHTAYRTIVIMYISTGLSLAVAAGESSQSPDGSVAVTCGSGCDCRLLSDDVNATLEVTCYSENGDDVSQQLAEIPVNTTNLLLISPIFDFNQLSFHHLTMLEHLTIENPDLQNYAYKNSDVRNQSVFHGLESLQSLTMNVVLQRIEPEAFRPLKSLKLLDISHTRKYKYKEALKFFRNFPRNLQVEILRLRNLQHPLGTESVNLNDLFRALSSLPLRSLDISENGFVEVTPGFNEYLPRLEEFISTYNVMSGEYSYRYCSFWDALVHPVLRHIDVSYQGTFGRPLEAQPAPSSGRQKRESGMALYEDTLHNHHVIRTLTEEQQLIKEHRIEVAARLPEEAGQDVDTKKWVISNKQYQKLYPEDPKRESNQNPEQNRNVLPLNHLAGYTEKTEEVEHWRTFNVKDYVGNKRPKRSFWSHVFTFNDCLKKALRGIFSDSAGTTCRFSNCLCSNLTSIPCDVLPIYTSVITTMPSCYLGVQVPLSPKLEVLSAHHLGLTGYNKLFDLDNHVDFCFRRSNIVKYIDVSNNRLGRYVNPFNLTILGLDKIRYMNLQHNDLKITNFGVLRGFASLETLLLGGNKLSLENKSAGEFLQGYTRLRSLDLASNELTSIHPTVLEPLTNLEVLNLSGNALTSIDFNIMTTMLSLQEINLSDNEIEVIPESTREDIERMTNESRRVLLDLSGNPLSCRCRDLDFVRWLRTTTVTFVGKGLYLCTDPQRGQISIWDVNLEELSSHCNPSYTQIIITAVLSTSAVFLLAGLGYLIYKKRWRLRFYLYAAKRGWGKYRNAAVESEFTYDAFVIYNSEDREWVHDVLRPTLEDEHELRLCLHYRDFIPGHNIEDEIVNNINASRKTLLVLSPNFLESTWCSFEMQMARMKYILEGRDVLVLVILRDLPINGVNKTLTRLLDSKTYLKWDEDIRAKMIFWDRLRRAIRVD